MSFRLNYRIIDVSDIPDENITETTYESSAFATVEKKKQERIFEKESRHFQDFILENHVDLDNLWFEILDVFKQYQHIESIEIDDIYSSYLNLIYDTYLLYH